MDEYRLTGHAGEGDLVPRLDGRHVHIVGVQAVHLVQHGAEVFRHSYLVVAGLPDLVADGQQQRGTDIHLYTHK